MSFWFVLNLIFVSFENQMTVLETKTYAFLLETKTDIVVSKTKTYVFFIGN